MRKEGKALSVALGRKKGTWKKVDADEDEDLETEEGVDDVEYVENARGKE